MSYSNLTDYPLPRVEESLLALSKRLAQLNTRHERHSGVEPAVSSILPRTRLTRPTLLPKRRWPPATTRHGVNTSIPPAAMREREAGAASQPMLGSCEGAAASK